MENEINGMILVQRKEVMKSGELAGHGIRWCISSITIP